MSNPKANITIPVDLTNPGQFFACCGLLELADRLWPGAEGWFDGDTFFISATSECSYSILMSRLARCGVTNTMTTAQHLRLKDLSAMTKKQREDKPTSEQEKKGLESLRRELPVVLTGDLNFQLDWFCDQLSGGSRFKTWAGQQSVLDISTNMHAGINAVSSTDKSPWEYIRGIGLPFNFDSDLGAQGSALDIGFSFDPLAATEATRIEGTCRPILELLAFIGLQRFRPQEKKGQNRFIFATWNYPLTPSIAATVACRSVEVGNESLHAFGLLYRTKYLKSFLPAIPFNGEDDE